MAINIKFTKFDNTPWGFRLAGGSDFPQPLTVIRVLEGSLAECMGLKVGDIVVRLNDQPISALTHGQAHEELMRAGNNFVLAVQRGEESLKAVEALSEENIVPYKIPLADLPPVFPEKILTEETVIKCEETTYEEKAAEEEAKPEVEPLPDKPKDANSEIVPNQNLTDDEIAQLILEEEELLNDKGVLGVNFKKLRPRATVLKQSKVIEELQNIATAEPPLVEQLRRTSVFLQKPQRPVPVPKKKEEEEEAEVESYKVVIKKQQKRSITNRLLESGLLKPEDEKTPEPPTPEVNTMDSNEMGTKVEEDDTLSSPSLVEAVDEEPTVTCSELLPPCLDTSSSLAPLDTSSSLDLLDTSSSLAPLEPETPTSPTSEPVSELASESVSEPEPESVSKPTPESVSEPTPQPVSEPVPEPASESPLTQFSQRRENVLSARRAPSKRKVKRFYTRAHYFRRCLFGKKGEAKKTSKVKPSIRVCQQDDAQPRQGRRESRIKGHYLETYLKREDNWMRRVVDGLLEKPDSFSSSESFGRLLSRKESSLWRTRYGERILARSVQFVAVRLCSDISKYLEGGRSKSILDSLEFNSPIRKRLYFKGRYFQRIFWRNFVRLINYISGSVSKDYRRDRRRSSMIKMKGHYMERCLQNSFLERHDLRDRFPKHPSVISSKRRLFVRTRYAERILKKHFESLGLIIEYVRCQVLQGISDSSAVLPTCSPLNCRQNEAKEEEGGLCNLIRSSKDFISTEVFHRGSRRLSRSCRGSVSAGPPSSLATALKSFGLDFNWLPSRLVGESSICDKKALQDGDRDGRRLSFVPTILYEGLTNRIGVDFTRLVAYAFVPCTSIILLYMYK
ncbi:uncharacterized protein LOC143186793 isoform X1 [Calliopsis andreniformis]|uniref:uncharacterized protein LOC143186793 isoform X1 n=1 Tax=Calliopsis andreniformis TaxID=337506 RepID=UPI003FCE2F95